MTCAPQKQMVRFICKLCFLSKYEDWSIKEYPFYICNECKV